MLDEQKVSEKLSLIAILLAKMVMKDDDSKINEKVWMLYQLGLDHKEIAQVLNTSYSSVTTQISSKKRELAKEEKSKKEKKKNA